MDRFAEAAARLAGAAGLLLGWRPDEFWRATPMELATTLGAGAEAETPMARRDLTQLMERFPDG